MPRTTPLTTVSTRLKPVSADSSAPLGMFLAGVAVGRGLPLEDAARTLTNLLAEPGPQAEDSPG